MAISSGAAALALAACAPAPGPRPTPPTDTEWIDSASPSARPAPAPRTTERWDLADQLRQLRPAAGRARSEHQGGDVEGEVLASQGSGYPLRGPASVAPTGATVVERLFPPG